MLPTTSRRTEFELSSVTWSKDMMGPKKLKMSHVTITTPTWGGLSSRG